MTLLDPNHLELGNPSTYFKWWCNFPLHISWNKRPFQVACEESFHDKQAPFWTNVNLQQSKPSVPRFQLNGGQFKNFRDLLVLLPFSAPVIFMAALHF
ncbi:hypothetical protein CEXT_244161 [Caerostris extrusa]|uniref:Uncharacterized protein n=1 Tax=Caerostris extrusa TaxID=172846 RepID=A0AAV4UWL3_CAEEX|nr:hypothetical protein CEXT_244161 [Caerostris extrusa]